MLQCNCTENLHSKEITSVSLREIMFIISTIFLFFTNGYSIYYIRSNMEFVNIIPRDHTSLGIEITDYALHRQRLSRNEVIVEAVRAVPVRAVPVRAVPVRAVPIN